MRKVMTALWLAGLVAGAGAAAERPAPPTFPGVRSLVWIAAHPDDEVLAAPLLGRLCVDEGIACTFLVLSRGEAGPCYLSGGCEPSLGVVRSREMKRSAELFGARLRLWSLPDNAGLAGWSEAAGGEDVLVNRIASFFEATAPDLVLTFDPRHGSTCHPDHRAVAELALAAVGRLPAQPAVFLLETRVALSAEPTRYRFSSAAGVGAGVIGWDATQRLPSSHVPGWRYLLETVEIHASQFDADAVRALRRVPRRQRAVYLAPAGAALASDSVRSCG